MVRFGVPGEFAKSMAALNHTTINTAYSHEEKTNNRYSSLDDSAHGERTESISMFEAVIGNL